MKKIEVEAIVIGGGATGTGTVRDLILRGVSTCLIEKDDIAYGTTGRNHGLLHSGARYAVKDTESARECIAENSILKKIASHCVEDCGGLFVTLPEDDPTYHNRLIDGCRFAGINARDISIKEALTREPNLNPNILSAIYVPDGTIDPFRLTASNILDAEEKGAMIFTHSKVTDIIIQNSRATGVLCENRNGDTICVYGDIIINASGAWAQQVCRSAGVELLMFPSKGSLLIIDYRINNTVVNRCRQPADADIIVPGDTVSLIGTTSRKIDYDKIDYLEVDDDEIDILLQDGIKLVPLIERARALRAYAGVRPLVAISGADKGREMSRGIVLIDHLERDGLDGFITITGGKLMTYRLMAEMAANLACQKLGSKAKCTTHKVPLPGSEKKVLDKKTVKKFTGIPKSVIGSTHYRHGQRVHDIIKKDKKNYRIICECEMVTEGEIDYAIHSLNVTDLVDLRRRTRIGMGPCQGELCAYRGAGLMYELGPFSPARSARLLKDFLEERWKGIKPVLWGDALRESEFTYWIYEGLFGLGSLKEDEIKDEQD